ncbi:hypothetical protein GCM10027514_26190 [Azotobacter armeniacus]
MATRDEAIARLRAWAGGSARPITDPMKTHHYALTQEQAKALWTLAAKSSGNPLPTDSPRPPQPR